MCHAGAAPSLPRSPRAHAKCGSQAGARASIHPSSPPFPLHPRVETCDRWGVNSGRTSVWACAAPSALALSESVAVASLASSSFSVSAATARAAFNAYNSERAQPSAQPVGPNAQAYAGPRRLPSGGCYGRTVHRRAAKVQRQPGLFRSAIGGRPLQASAERHCTPTEREGTWVPSTAAHTAQVWVTDACWSPLVWDVKDAARQRPCGCPVGYVKDPHPKPQHPRRHMQGLPCRSVVICVLLAGKREAPLR